MVRPALPAVRALLALSALLVPVVLALAACTPETDTRSVAFGLTEKVCQLTGDTDWETGQPTTAQTSARYGFEATDLGYPVEHQGRLALLFGDSRSPAEQGPRNELGPPDDAVGWITTRTPPTPGRCPDVQVNSRPWLALPGLQHLVRHPLVLGPAIKQGIFNVPSGGASDAGRLYGFFWTDHCNTPSDSATCPQSADLNGIGRAVLAWSVDSGRSFQTAGPLPRDFVYATAVATADIPDLPADQRLGTYVFAVPTYRESVPYLAYAPAGRLGELGAWRFFVGRAADGQPTWISSAAWQERGRAVTPPGQPELFAATGAPRCVGEFSVTWNRVLHLWLMLYNCGPGPDAVVLARVADAPWGPWSIPTAILTPSDSGVACRLLMAANGCGRRPTYWPPDSATGAPVRGALYAPFVLERFTTSVQTFLPRKRSAMIYWVVSTWNPYQVAVVRTVVETWGTRATLAPRTTRIGGDGR